MEPHCAKRSLLVLLCTVVTAAIPVRLAGSEAAFQDLPVPGGTVALARTLGIDPVPDRGRFIAEVTRLVFDLEARNPSAAAFLQAVRLKAQAADDKRRGSSRPASNGDPAGFDLVPVPLSAEIWSDAVFRRRVAPDELVTTIVADRQAALICHGLTALDDETLEFFADHSSLVSHLYERSAPAFGVFSESIRIRGNRVVPPGSMPGPSDARQPAQRGRDEVSALWEAVVGEKVTRPERFLTALFELGEGRVAYLYDVVGHLDAARRAFVLGLWMDDSAQRLERFRVLASVGLGAFKDWRLRTMPYGRAPWDFAMAVTRLEVTEGGAPAAPASRSFWSRVLSTADLSEDVPATAKGIDDAPFDAAWLAERLGDSDIRQRVEHLDQIALAQRRFAAMAVADVTAATVAVRALPHYRMLILTLDRIGVQAPSLYAAAARQAQRLSSLANTRGFVAQAQFQAALAILSRMVTVRTVTARQAEYLIERLIAARITEEGRFAGGIVRWVRDDLRPAIAASAAGETLEAAFIAAVAGQASGEGTSSRLTWEGQRYRLDLGFAERRRLLRVRERQEAVPIDIPIQLGTLARRLTSEAAPAAEIDEAVKRLTKIAELVPKHQRPDAQPGGPAGVSAGFDAHDTLTKTIDELVKIGRSRDVRREARVAETLVDLADELLAHALLSFAYAMNIGDPDGPALLAGDVSYRHDFGFGIKDGPMRSRAAWALARQEVAPGVPWHVSGSLLALEIGLAPLALRRMNFEHLTGAPKLTSNERDTFAASVAVMNPYALRDADRDAIVDAISRGRERVLALATDHAAFEPAADAVGLAGRRRRELRWTLAHDPGALLSMFSMTELLSLGGGDLRALDAWGMIGLGSTGCLCSRLTPPGRWWLLAGRPQLGIIATGVADLNLHVAARLKELQMPAALAKVVLSGAVQDFIDEVQPTDEGDWLTLARMSRIATREQIEDYLAVATADGPLVPDLPSSPPQPR
jgi:hypothetical protein